MPARVLVVDDDEDILTIVADYLQMLGYDVVSTRSGREALGMVDGTAFDAAVIDWTLPDADGREMLRGVKGAQPRCGVILTTGHGAEVVSEAIAGTWSASILRKPFTMRSLGLRVEVAVSGGRSEL
jgi:DNA-binding response OmpR family regulator